jgi:hypothetical protein
MDKYTLNDVAWIQLCNFDKISKERTTIDHSKKSTSPDIIDDR